VAVSIFFKARKIPHSVLKNSEAVNHYDREISLPDGTSQIYIDTPQLAEQYAKEILRFSSSSWSVWSLDAEWRPFQPAGKGKVALLQFCRDKVVLLFHICSCQLTPSLLQVLKCPNIFKVGVNINGDVLKLERDYPELLGHNSIQGCCDVREICRLLNLRDAPCSLAALTTRYIKLTLPKPDNIRKGNWERVPLSRSQADYAALDSYATYRVFEAVIMESCMPEGGNEGENTPYLELSPNDRLTRTHRILTACELNYIRNKKLEKKTENFVP